MSKTITIASIQMFVHKNKKQNIEQVEKHLKYLNKVFPQVEMVVFPELSVSESTLEPKEQAEKIPGELTHLFSRLAKKYGLWLIPGSIYEKSGSKIYNTSVVFSPEGDFIGKYRKRFPWCPYEKTVPGKEPFVFTIEGVGKIGLMICYDLWFPEVARDLVDLGAEAILVPTMTTTGDRSQEQVISQAIAITQQAYVVSCNGVGFGGVGGSLIIDPDGNILQQSGGSPFVQTAILDFERVAMLRDKGVAGISHPWKDFRQNKQIFNVYNKNSKS
tara:strand:- start:52 stop:870 length:819 start_codon:yes stop_codon:yes gene_type:complete